MKKQSIKTWLVYGVIFATAGCIGLLLFISLMPSSNSRDNQDPTKGDKYTIHPGGGANRAKVIIDFKAGSVKVYVAWS